MVKDGAAEQHVHNVEEGYTEDVPGFIKNAERNKKLWFERVNLWMLYHKSSTMNCKNFTRDFTGLSLVFFW
jgi:hypothetical protein